MGCYYAKTQELPLFIKIVPLKILTVVEKTWKTNQGYSGNQKTTVQYFGCWLGPGHACNNTNYRRKTKQPWRVVGRFPTLNCKITPGLVVVFFTFCPRQTSALLLYLPSLTLDKKHQICYKLEVLKFIPCLFWRIRSFSWGFETSFEASVAHCADKNRLC